MDNLLPDRVVIALYFAGVAGAGYWGLRRARSPEGYLVAGRRLTAAAGALASMVAGSVVVVSVAEAENLRGAHEGLAEQARRIGRRSVARGILESVRPTRRGAEDA